MSNELNSPNRFGFIPKRLAIEERPDLNDFPLNILFVNFFLRNGERWAAEALYKPELETLEVEQTWKRLRYNNIYNQLQANSAVTITKRESGWWGEKTVNGIRVGGAIASTWQEFFAYFTGKGLSKGEPCKFERLQFRLQK